MEKLKQILKEVSEFSTQNEKVLFVIIKPGFLNLTKEVIDTMVEHGWEFKRIKSKRLLLSEAQQLYKIHKKEDWYESLCKYMASDITIGLLFHKPGQVERKDFKEMDEIKDGIREKYGESDMRNVIHSSDSFKHLKDEASLYFNSL